ncbi:MAG: hemolysin III family protein [Zoogloea sp.]|nr:hemolysin III family protein [Zoogloea sp.]
MNARAQSRAEEIANSVSHGLGCVLALAFMPFLIGSIAERGPTIAVVGSIVFAVTMVLLYFASALYHALPDSRAKVICGKLDHGAIYLFIAGSYTPFALGVLNGAWGWSLFGVVWGLAGIGITLKMLDRLSHPLWSTGLYLLMGWLVVAAAVPLIARMPSPGLLWLLAGGLAYTAGVIFFLTDARVRFGHFIWHLFVMAGTACHAVAVAGYSL